MPYIDAGGVQVNFPFEPYPCQIDYMTKVINCLKGAQNGILESPTGTGKTLCLLCSSLAWLEDKKAQISNHKWKMGEENAETPLTYYKDQLANQLDDAAGTWKGEMAPPKIIYASRTHSQLSQAIQEMKRTAYRHFKVCVLGSREQLCIHEKVSKEESNAVKVHLCRAKVSARTCFYYNNLENAKGNFSNLVLDIEDLVKMGEKHKCCPYYTARELKAEADIIFMPYNYLLDPKSRKAHGVELQGNIVIFDEAHNLEKICEDSASFDLSSADIASAIRELSEVSDKLQEWMSAEQQEEGFGAPSDDNNGLASDFTLRDIFELKALLHKLEETMDQIPIPKPNEGITKEGSYIFEVLKDAKITFESKAGLIELIDKIVAHLNSETTGAFHSKGSGLSKIGDVIKIVFSREPEIYSSISHHQKIVSQHYKVHIRQAENKNLKKKAGSWDTVTSNKAGRVISYWCFSPGHTMQELKAHGVKSIILTSGTLSPMSSFKTEMGIDFNVELENPHVIEKHQVWIGTMGRGPDGTELNSSYQHRFKEEYQASLGNAVVNFARIVPNGLLLFFPSYPVMDKCLETWQKLNIWTRIEQYKPIFIEPKGKREYQTAIDNFYQRIHDPTYNGAIFAAVCRGKVSEGLDFSDINGRAVVITGLPFPPRMDPKVVLKMKFLDEMRSKGGKGLSGQEWYRQQASRAVNQAIGRVIRHRQDYGAIILCDNRFAGPSAQSQLPSWLRSSVTVYSAFGKGIGEIIKFFKNAEKTLPAPLGVKQKMRTASLGCQGASFVPTINKSATAGIPLGSVPRASAVSNHVSSLQRNKQDEMSLAKLKIQYETTAPTPSTSQKSQSGKGLLNALDFTEKRETGIPSTPSLIPMSELISTQKWHNEKKGKKKIVIKKAGTNCTITETTRSEVSKKSLMTAESYVAEVKQTLSADSYKFFSKTLANYKKTTDFVQMVSCLAEIFTDNPRNYHLFRQFYAFVRPQHKKDFDNTCRELTGKGCGYKEEDSIPKKRLAQEVEGLEEKRRKIQTESNSKDTKETDKCNKAQDFNKLDGGHLGSGAHLNHGVLSNNDCQNSPAKKNGDSTLSLGCVTSKSDEIVDKRNIFDRFAKKETENKNDNISDSAGENPPKEATKQENVPQNLNSMTPGMQVYFKLKETGYTCSWCKKDASVPLKAQCDHICCMECWKVCIRETKKCPECGEKVKRKQLSRICFPGGPNKDS